MDYLEGRRKAQAMAQLINNNILDDTFKLLRPAANPALRPQPVRVTLPHLHPAIPQTPARFDLQKTWKTRLPSLSARLQTEPQLFDQHIEIQRLKADKLEEVSKKAQKNQLFFKANNHLREQGN